MNLSMKWLADFTDVSDVNIKDYCDRMTDTGSKVEGYETLGEDIENVVVAKILSIKPHENSDHLLICQMDVGRDAPVQIVTGAQNIFEGAIVPAALPVAKLPGGVVIKAGKLRGVESSGMLCSMGELGLTAHDMPGKVEDGILILDDEYADKIGQDIRDVLLLNDKVVEFEITSNRPDCLSVIGLARETAVSFDREYKIPTPTVRGSGDGDKIENHLSVRIDAPDLCSRYAARVVKNVRIAPSPLWLRMRLRAAGVRPINNIVDITNYVMLEYGQPMHAFDYQCLDSAEIIVRRAKDGESFKSLDDIDHTLDSSMLVIADKNKACALAGVMGGANSEIKDSTTTVVFESACFDGASVRVTAKKNGMRTESSARFEKGLDPENCAAGLARACELVELLDAGDVVDGVIDLYPGKKDATVLKLETERINRFLGVNLTEDYMKQILTRLECKIDGDKITVPSFRADLGCMNDIAEEIIRIYGYNKIEATRIKAETTQGGRTPKQKMKVDITDMLCDLGVNEIQTYSFISPKYYDKIRMTEGDSRRKSIVISNPLGEDTIVMRTTSLPSMLEVVARNNNLSNENVALFEMASTYIPDESPDKLPREGVSLTLAMYGDTDFYKLKSICEAIFTLAGIRDTKYEAYTEDNAFHPGRCASVSANGKALATLGQIHPLTAENYGFDMPVYAAVIDFDALFDASDREKHYTPLPKYPASTRDFSFVCEESLEVGSIFESVRRAGGKLVEDIKLFDIYRGTQVGEGKKSVSIRVTLRAADRTLTVEEAEKTSRKILSDLEHKLGITLR
ncbi:MAG: phenylalanine--tRNA ligase subunit beta [Clostridia bacterium]|nr:phenylalanine--tRNA ligase subunit beta [Clostridia bacterium]